MSSDELLVDTGNVFTVNVNGIPVPVDINILSLMQYLTCANNKFTSIAGNLPTEVKSNLNKIIIKTGTAIKQIICVVLIGLLILFILLVLTIFAAIYGRDSPYAIAAALALALFFIIIITIIIYQWTLSIYSSSATAINIDIANINKLLILAQGAILPTLCSLGETDCQYPDKST